MSENKEKSSIVALDKFPWSIIFTRWLFLCAELGIALYFVFNFKFNIGLLFLIYALICGMVLLPLLRCTKCYYYGKRCNFGWGVWVPKIFPKSDDQVYSSAHGVSFLFWPLRVIPIGLGSIQIIGAIKFSLAVIGEDFAEIYSIFIGSLDYFDLLVLAVYFIVIYLHRKFYRSLACTRCLQRDACPVYNYEVIPRELSDTDTA
jgi:hypothetical protein